MNAFEKAYIDAYAEQADYSPFTNEEIDSQARKEIQEMWIDAYIDEWGVIDRNSAAYVADQIEEDKMLPPTVVIIPVAAHAEARNIVPAMVEYAKQQNAGDFAVHLHLNWPMNLRGSDSIKDSFDEVTRARGLFPHLDIRLSQMEYPEDPNIGEIRRTAWNGTLMHLVEQGNQKDAIGFNHDIDLVRLSPNYIANVKKYYSEYTINGNRPSVLPPAGTQGMHALDPRYPNTSAAVFWTDFTNRMDKGVYEASLVLPMTVYSLEGGFKKESRTYETSHFASKVKPMAIVPGTRLDTSIRRYLHRFPDNEYHEVWAPDTFSAEDDSRILTEFTDISHDEMIRKVTQDATHFGAGYLNYLTGWHLSQEDLEDLISDDPELQAAIEEKVQKTVARTERMTRLVLNGLEVPRVGEFLSDHLFSESFVEHVLYVLKLQVARSKALDEARKTESRV